MSFHQSKKLQDKVEINSIKKLANKPTIIPRVLNIKEIFKRPEPIIAFVINNPVNVIEDLFVGCLFSPSSSPGSSLYFLYTSFSAFSGSVSLIFIFINLHKIKIYKYFQNNNKVLLN